MITKKMPGVKARRITLRSTDRPKPPAREKSVPIIIEAAADGFIQVYGPRHVRPIIFDRLVARRAEEAELVEHFHELELPRPYREFYFPKHVLKTHLIEKRTLEKEIQRRERLVELHAYQAIAEGARKQGGRT